MKAKYLLPVVIGGMITLAACSTVENKFSLSKLFSSQTQSSIRGMDSTQLYNVQSTNLCAAYHGTQSPIIKAELVRRDLITSDWSDINSGEVWKGMNMCALLAAKGMPTAVVKGNSFVELDYGSNSYNFLSSGAQPAQYKLNRYTN